jgi:hypothetical protein
MIMPLALTHAQNRRDYECYVMMLQYHLKSNESIASPLSIASFLSIKFTCKNALTDARKRRVSRRRRREDGRRAGRDKGVLRHLQRADHHGRRVVVSLKVENKKEFKICYDLNQQLNL